MRTFCPEFVEEKKELLFSFPSTVYIITYGYFDTLQSSKLPATMADVQYSRTASLFTCLHVHFIN